MKRKIIANQLGFPLVMLLLFMILLLFSASGTVSGTTEGLLTAPSDNPYDSAVSDFSLPRCAPEIPLPAGRGKAPDETLKLKDSNNKELDAEIKILAKKVKFTDNDKTKGLFMRTAASSSTKSDEKTYKESYDIEIKPKNSHVKKLVLNDLEIDENFESVDLGIDSVSTTAFAPPVGKEWKAVYAVDPSRLSFTSGTLTAVATGTELYKCKDWNFDSAICEGEWVKLMDTVPGQEYEITITPNDPGFAETGVATVNTKKSIYLPGETAEIIMVVLDTGGYLVGDADVTLKIFSPSGTETRLSTDSEIEETEKGIYEASYPASEIGNYTLLVTATASGVNSTLLSYFTVQNSYEFDIIRFAPVTIDPWQGPFTASMKIVPPNDTVMYSFKESIPENFTVVDSGDATVYQQGDRKILTWSGLSNNSVIYYSVQAPFVTPDLTLIGPAVIEYGSPGRLQEFNEARPWYIAVDPASSSGVGNVATVDLILDTGTASSGNEVNDLQADDSAYVQYNKNKAHNVETFTTGLDSATIISGGTATLHVIWTVQSGWSGQGNCVEFTVEGESEQITSICPADGQVDYEQTDSVSVTTVGDLEGADTYYYNDDRSGGDYIQIDRVWLTFDYEIYDADGPQITLINPVVNANLSTSAVNFTYNASDSINTVANCSILLNGSVQDTKTSITENATQWFELTSLNGSYSWSVSCRDSATGGNSNTSGTRVVTVDLDPPEIQPGSPADNIWTNEVATTFSYTPTDNRGVISSCFLVLNNQQNETDSSINEGISNSFSPVALLEGVNTWSVNCTDYVGWEGASSQRTIIVDRTNPDVTPLSPDDLINSTSKSMNFTWSVSDSLDSGMLCNITINGTQNNTVVIPVDNNSVGWHYLTGMADASYTWQVTCADNASNSATTNLQSLVVDTEFPKITLETINATDVGVNDYVCLNVTVTDIGTTVKSVSARVYKPSSGLTANLSLSNDGLSCGGGGNIWSYELMNDESGEYIWNITYAEDFAGNINSSSSLTRINWTATASFSMNSTMTAPSATMRINEIYINNEYTQSCTLNCTSGPCNDVFLYAQYYDSSWMDISTDSSMLINAEDNHSCGTLASDETCSHSFTITSGTTAGANDYPVMCIAKSSNAPTSNSGQQTVSINDQPIAVFTYPSNLSWLAGIETLNASLSSDDEIITNYKFDLDSSSDFSSPSLIYSGLDGNTSFNTSAQVQCNEDVMGCKLRLNITDNESLWKTTILTIGFDNTGPAVTLDLPANSTTIYSTFYTVNASAEDDGSGVDSITFWYRTGPAAEWFEICNDSESPYSCNWNTSSLADGSTYQIKAGANDSVGTWGDNDTHVSITLQRAPVVTSISPVDTYNSTNGDVLFSFNTSSVAETGIGNCTLMIDGVENLTNSTIAQNTTLYFQLYDIDYGNYDWNITCRNNNSNGLSGASQNRVLNVISDTADPDTVLISPSPSAQLSITTVSFSYNVTDALSGIENCSLYINSTFNQSNSSIQENQNLVFSASFVEGDYTWYVTCVDDSKNTNSNSTSAQLFSIVPIPSASVCINLSADGVHADNAWTNPANAEIDDTIPASVVSKNNYLANTIENPETRLTATSIYNISLVAQFYCDVAADDGFTWNYVLSPTLYTDPAGIQACQNSERDVIWTPSALTTWTQATNIVTEPYAQASGSQEVSAWYMDYVYVQVCYANLAPLVSVAVDDSSTLASPTSMGNNVNFTVTAYDLEGDNYTLLVCNDTQSGGACTGITYCESSITLNSSQASCASDTTGLSGSYSWQAYVCDSNMVCNNDTNVNSPFYVNNAPILSGVSANVSLVSNGNSINITTVGVSDNESNDLRLECGPSSGVYSSCQGAYGQGNRTCSFSNSWTDDAVHTIYCAINDSFAYSSEFSVDFTSDNTAPSLVLGLPIENYNTTETDITFNFTATDTNFDSLACNISIDGIVNASTVNATNETSYPHALIGMGDSVHTWQVVCWDDVGNKNTSSLRQFTIDTTAPNTTLISPAPNDWKTDLVSLYYNVTDVLSDISNCSLLLNGSITNTTNSPDEDQQLNFDYTFSDDSTYNWTVQCRDTLGNTNTAHSRLVRIDTAGPTVSVVKPSSDENISTDTYNISASASDSGSGVDSVLFWYRVNDTASWQSICSDSTSPYNCTWNLAVLPDSADYQVRAGANDTLSNLAVNDTHTSIIIDRTVPAVSLISPANNDWSDANATFFYTASDETSSVASCSIYINNSLDNTTTSPGSGTLNFTKAMTTADYSWYINCSDSLGNSNSTELRTLKLDSDYPSITQSAVNRTTVNITEVVCLNTTVTDIGSGLEWVYAYIIPPNNIPTKVRLYDNVTTSCDGDNGNDVFSFEYTINQVGLYNWSKTYANDTAVNLGDYDSAITFTSTSINTLSVNMTQPDTNFRINESGHGTNYSYSQFCNVTCGPAAQNCTSTFIYVQYNLSGATDMTDSTSYLFSSEDNHSCGTLTPGESCVNTFTITTSTDSGNQDWGVWCRAESDSVGSYVSSMINLTVNDHPVSNFTYPDNSTWISGMETFNMSYSSDDASLARYSIQIDSDSSFASPSTIYNNSDNYVVFNTSNQSQCTEELMNCYMRLTVKDDDGLENYTDIVFGIDNIGPSTLLDRPLNSSSIITDTYSVNATASDSGSGVDSVMFYYSDGVSWYSMCNSSQCTWNLTSIVDGTGYMVRTRSNDSEGNYGQNDTHVNITVDRGAPAIDLTSPVDSYNTTDNWVLLEFTAEDSIASLTSCQLHIDGQANQTNSSVINSTATGFNVSNLVDKMYYWNVTCTDYSSNQNWSETRTFRIDTGAPSITLNSPSNESIVQEGDTVYFTITDGYALYSAWYSLSGAANSTSFTGSYDISTSGWAEGVNTLDVYANDSAGNLAHESYQFTSDSTAPSVGLVYPDSDYRTQLTSMSFNFSANDSISSTLNCTLYINGGANQTNATSYNDTLTGFTLSSLAEAQYYWNVSCIDESGRTGWSETRNFTIDNTAPSLSGVSPSLSSTYELNEEVIIFVTVTENVMVDYVYANVTWDSSLEKVVLTDPEDDGIFSGVFSTTSSLGDYNISIQVNDTLGFSDSDATNFSVEVALINMGTPNYANLTDGPSILSFGYGGDSNKNVTSQLAVQEGSCSTANCADLDERSNYGGASLEMNWIGSLDAGTTISDARTRIVWDYDGAKGVPSPEAYVFYLDSGVWQQVCSENVPLSSSSYFCDLGAYIDTVSEANNVSLLIYVNDSWGGSAGDEPEARVWVNVANFSLGYYDSQLPSVTSVSAVPATVNVNDAVNISATVTDNYGVNRSFAYVLYPNGTTTSYSMTSSGDTWSYNFSSTVLVGVYNVTLYAYDNQNNLNNTEKTSFTVNDIIEPFIILNSPVNNHNTSNTYINFSWTPYDNIYDNITCNLTLDGIINKSGLSTNNNTELNWTLSDLAEGNHSWNVTCWDLVNNTNTSETRAFVILGAPSNITTNITGDGSSITFLWNTQDYADSYNVYIKDSFSDSFPSSPNVTGVASNSWTDADANESTERYYKIESVRGSSNQTAGVLGKFSQSLTYDSNSTDWNLVSIPLTLSDWHLNNASYTGYNPFVNPSECVEAIWRLNSTGGWEKVDYVGGEWIPSAQSKNFTKLEAGKGYWFEVNQSCTFTAAGEVPDSNVTLSLVTGWNLVGWNSPQEATLPAGAEPPYYPITVFPLNSVQVINRYNTQQDSFEVTLHHVGWGWWPSWNNQEFTTLEPMRAYYFDVNQSAMWNYDPII